jgi:hypothetical protein
VVDEITIQADYYVHHGEVFREERKRNAGVHALQRCWGLLHGHCYDSGKVAERLYEMALSAPGDQRATYRSYLEEFLTHNRSQASSVHSVVNALLSTESAAGSAVSAVGSDGLRLLHAVSHQSHSTFPLGKKVASVVNRMTVVSKWRDLGLDLGLIETDYASVQFLISTRLIYHMVGLHNASALGKSRQPVLATDGKASILCDGSYVPVSEITARFQFDYSRRQLIEKSTNLPWNYLLPRGIVQAERYASGPLLPVTRLDEEEMKRLLAHAGQFQGLSFRPEEPATCVFQLCTGPRPIPHVPQSPLLDGFHAQMSHHVWFRIIDGKGNVYSTGTWATPEEGMFRAPLPKVLATITAHPAILDWQECRPHQGRLVTSVPMTQRQCDEMIKVLNEMRERGVRLNAFHQNCAQWTTAIARLAGVHIEHRVPVMRALITLLPHESSFPPLHRVVGTIRSLVRRHIPKVVLNSARTLVGGIQTVISYCLKPVTIVMRAIANLALLAFGGGSGTPVQNNLYEDTSRTGMQRFRALINSPWDIFSVPITIDHPGPIVAWQRRQTTTILSIYNRVPIVNVLPEPSTGDIDKFTRAFQRFDTI